MSALIAAGLSLVSGLFGKNSEKKAIKAQNAYNDPKQVRARAEAAGFNPLLFIGPGVGQQTATGGGNYMGEAIANAGLALTDGIQKKQMMDIERSRLKMDQQKLDLLIQSATIRPKSGGIYAGNVSAPSLGGVGGSNGSNFARVPFGLSGGGSVRVGASVSNVNPNAPKSSSDDASKVPTLPLMLLGEPIKPVSNTSDAESFGSRYGEDFLSPGWFAGWTAAGADGAYATKEHFKLRYNQIVGSNVQQVHQNASNLTAVLGPNWHNQQGSPPALPGGYAGVSSAKKQQAWDKYWSAPTRDAWPKFQLGR
jgi:hypothetical protein